MSTDRNRMSKEEILFKGIVKDTQLQETTLRLIALEKNPERLRDILFGLEIGDKREILSELRNYVNRDLSLRDEKRQEYLDAIDDNEAIYEEIEDIIIGKLGIDKVKFDVRGYDGIRDTTDNFRDSHIEMVLRSNLKSISNTQRLLQSQITNVEVSSANAKYILQLMNKTVDDTVDWLEYIEKQKNSGKFDLYEDEYIELLDETIAECKKTLVIEAGKRERIVNDFPDIAREVDEEEENRNRTQSRDRQNSREHSDDGDER